MQSVGAIEGFGDNFGEMARGAFQSLAVETIMWLLVVVNCATLGFATQGAVASGSAADHRPVYGAEVALSIIFVGEILLRFMAFGRKAFRPVNNDSTFNLVDALVVFVTNVIAVWVLVPAGMRFLEEQGWIIRLIMLFRVIRLAHASEVFPLREGVQSESGEHRSEYELQWLTAPNRRACSGYHRGSLIARAFCVGGNASKAKHFKT